MLTTVYSCIRDAHDLNLVALAAVICAISSLTVIKLLRQSRQASGQARVLWLTFAAICTGFGIWATHFIAMLAYSPGVDSGYNLPLTAVSLAIAIAISGVGLTTAAIGRSQWTAGLGGVIVGIGVAAMHYSGMAAYELQAVKLVDQDMVTTSIVIGAVLAALAMMVSMRGEREYHTLLGAVLLTLAICGLHFFGMSAITISPDPTVTISQSVVPAFWLAVVVALISAIVIGSALIGIRVEQHERKRSRVETERLLGLANAAIEGLLICDKRRIVTANASFADLTGLPIVNLCGSDISDYFPELTDEQLSQIDSERPVETSLLRRGGEVIPVEVIHRVLHFGDAEHEVFAVRDLRERNEAARHIRFLAHYDSLTGLPNRSVFHEQLDQSIARLHPNRKVAVLCFDLDRFKEINDLFGHAAGDKVLQLTTQRISALLGDSQLFARLGGDEFGILLPDIASADVAAKLADTIVQTLNSRQGVTEFGNVTASVGIALCPDDATERDPLLAAADTALYSVKADGRASYRFFEATMGHSLRERRMIEHDLRSAIANDQLALVYQPQEGRQRGVTLGFEALVRWNHPVRGFIPPNIFIPIAEGCGAILDIGDWVMCTACREAATWKQPLMIAVNVSAVQLYHDGFAERVEQILRESGLEPGRLELELTETALIRDPQVALSTLRRVKALGVRLAMDDFGTGYSSLSNLRAFPFDKIKIDGSFVRQVNSNAEAATIVRAVVGLGRGLGLPVLAEGVETEEELEFLNMENCDEVQGYLLGRPAAIENFSAVTGQSGEAASSGAAPALQVNRAPEPALAG